MHTVHEQHGGFRLNHTKRYQNGRCGSVMAKASRQMLLLAAIGLFVLALFMLLRSDNVLMAVPLIGVSVLTGFGYMMFNGNSSSKPNSTPGAIQHKTIHQSQEIHKESLPDVTQSDYDVPIL